MSVLSTPRDADLRPLADLIDVEVRQYRTLKTPVGDIIAKHMAELADRIRFLDAKSVDDYHDRYQAMLDSVRYDAIARDAARLR